MGHAIHHRVINGQSRYRVWSTTTDSYVTEEMTLDEVRTFEIEYAAQVARENATYAIGRRLERAHGPGGSSGFEEPSLATGWKKEGPFRPEDDEG